MNRRLRLINSMLATSGTARLSAQDTRHPSYLKANDLLEDIIEEFSTREWWFNTSIRILQPNEHGRVLVPAHSTTCDPTNSALKYTVRNQYLFDTQAYTDIISNPVECIIIAELDIETMPVKAYQYIRACARYQYALDADVSARKIAAYDQDMRTKDMYLIAENMKQQDTNFFTSPAYVFFRARRYGRGGTLQDRLEIGHLGNNQE